MPPQPQSAEAFLLRVAGIDIYLYSLGRRSMMCEVAILPPTRGPSSTGTAALRAIEADPMTPRTANQRICPTCSNRLPAIHIFTWEELTCFGTSVIVGVERIELKTLPIERRAIGNHAVFGTNRRIYPGSAGYKIHKPRACIPWFSSTDLIRKAREAPCEQQAFLHARLTDKTLFVIRRHLQQGPNRTIICSSRSDTYGIRLG